MKVRLQIRERYTKDYYVDVDIDNEDKLNEILDECEYTDSNYEEILDELINNGFKISNVKESDFDFEDNSFIDYEEVKEKKLQKRENIPYPLVMK